MRSVSPKISRVSPSEYPSNKIQLAPSPAQQPKTTYIAHPPSKAPKQAPIQLIDPNVNKPKRHPRNRIYKSCPIYQLPLDSRKSSKTHSADEQNIILDGVRLRGLIAPHHLEPFW